MSINQEEEESINILQSDNVIEDANNSNAEIETNETNILNDQSQDTTDENETLRNNFSKIESELSNILQFLEVQNSEEAIEKIANLLNEIDTLKNENNDLKQKLKNIDNSKASTSNISGLSDQFFVSDITASEKENANSSRNKLMSNNLSIEMGIEFDKAEENINEESNNTQTNTETDGNLSSQNSQTIQNNLL